jgi:hypothetical protein
VYVSAAEAVVSCGTESAESSSEAAAPASLSDDDEVDFDAPVSSSVALEIFPVLFKVRA